MANNPLAGAAWATAAVTVFLLSWQLYVWVVCVAGIVVGSARLYHGQRGKLIRAFGCRLLRACILLVCKPRPVDGKFFHFCYPDHARI